MKLSGLGKKITRKDKIDNRNIAIRYSNYKPLKNTKNKKLLPTTVSRN
jgi:hypothetical protein